MRRSSIFAVAALLALTAPAFADELSDAKDAIEAASLSTETDMTLWCAGAYSLALQFETDEAIKKTDDEMATALFNKAVPLMTADKVADADQAKLAQDFVVVVKSELVDKLTDPQHTQEECAAAAKA
jgi:hypothetical protein